VYLYVYINYVMLQLFYLHLYNIVGQETMIFIKII